MTSGWVGGPLRLAINLSLEALPLRRPMGPQGPPLGHLISPSSWAFRVLPSNPQSHPPWALHGPPLDPQWASCLQWAPLLTLRAPLPWAVHGPPLNLGSQWAHPLDPQWDSLELQWGFPGPSMVAPLGFQWGILQPSEPLPWALNGPPLSRGPSRTSIQCDT